MSAQNTIWYGVNTALVKYVPQDTQYNKLDIFSVERIPKRYMSYRTPSWSQTLFGYEVE